MEVVDPDHDGPIRSEAPEVSPPAARERLEPFGGAQTQKTLIDDDAGPVRECRDGIRLVGRLRHQFRDPTLDRLQRRLPEIAREDLMERGLYPELSSGAAASAKDVSLAFSGDEELLRCPRLSLAGRRDEQGKDGLT